MSFFFSRKGLTKLGVLDKPDTDSGNENYINYFRIRS